MNRIIFLLILAIAIFISCGDGRAACYAEPNRVGKGVCELIIILDYNYYTQKNSQIPHDEMAKNFLICQKQEQDRKRCDSRSEWWPLPKNLNHPSGNENILSIIPEK